MAVLEGSISGNLAEVDANNRLKINLANANNANEVGGVRIYSENDSGSVSGVASLQSPETDDDYRLRISQEAIYDTETFNYTAMNTGKHQYRITTMTAAWATSGFVTNNTNITTTTTGLTLSTWAEFPILGASALYCEVEGSFSAQPQTLVTIEFGMARFNTTHPYAPTDGAFFRLNSGGLAGIISYNGAETSTGVFSGFTITQNQKYQFIVAITEREVEFWIDGVLYGTIETPVGQGQPCMSSSLPFALKHAIVGGAAGGALSFTLNDYTVSIGGTNIVNIASTLGNRLYGAYQGLSGGTMGSLATYPNSTNPTAAAPANTALTANLPGGLGGQGIATAPAVGVGDLIFGSYQVPAGTVSVQGRRLVLKGVNIDAVNTGAAVATTATTIQWSLAFGHTAASMATADVTNGSAATKAPRRIALGYMTWPVAAAIGAAPQMGALKIDFGDAPVFVNPGEFIAIVGKVIVGTATASQTITYIWQPLYGWE